MSSLRKLSPQKAAEEKASNKVGNLKSNFSARFREKWFGTMKQPVRTNFEDFMLTAQDEKQVRKSSVKEE